MRLALSLLLVLFGCSLYAVPYKGNVMSFKQPDASIVSVKLFGDEYYIRAESVDGYTVVRDAQTQWICYAVASSDKTTLLSTGIQYNGSAVNQTPSYKNKALRKHEDISLDARLKQTHAIRAQLSGSVAHSDIHSRGTPIQTVSGSIKGLCILVDFPDDTASLPVSEFNDFCNDLNYSNYGNNGSLRTYYQDISGGLLDYQNVVFGFYHASKNFTYYDSLPYSVGAKQVLDEALHWIESQGFDFSTLSLNPDNTIRAINLMYTGVPPTWAKGMWHHKGNYTGFSSNGIRSNDYNCSPANAPLKIAVVAHENGHMIGKWPDTYKYTNTTGDDGIGTFDLMCWPGDDGGNPVPPNPLFRSNAGWGRVVDISTANGIQLDTANSMTCYRYYNSNDSNEFYLLENRTKTGRSTQIEDEGLTIWHIDRNGNNQTTHHEVFLEHANNDSTDNSKACFRNGFNAAFSANTSPSSRCYNGDPSGLHVWNISNRGNVMSYELGNASGNEMLRLRYARLSLDPNGNGFIDKQENFAIQIQAMNLGLSKANGTTVTCELLQNTNYMVTMTNSQFDLGVLDVQEIKTLTFTGYVNPLTNVGSELVFRFTIRSDHDSIYITKTFVLGPIETIRNTTLSSCDALYLDDGFTNDYYDNRDIVQTIFPLETWNPVKIQFLAFNLENSTDCMYDYLEIFNGKDTQGTMLGRFCSDRSPGTIVSSDSTGALTLHFHSDEGVSASGWKALLQCKYNADLLSEYQVDVFPNPVIDQIQIRSYKYLMYHVRLTSLLGHVVRNFQLLNENEWRFSCQGLQSGIYILEVETETGITRKKMVIL